MLKHKAFHELYPCHTDRICDTHWDLHDQKYHWLGDILDQFPLGVLGQILVPHSPLHVEVYMFLYFVDCRQIRDHLHKARVGLHCLHKRSISHIVLGQQIDHLAQDIGNCKIRITEPVILHCFKTRWGL